MNCIYVQVQYMQIKCELYIYEYENSDPKKWKEKKYKCICFDWRQLHPAMKKIYEKYENIFMRNQLKTTTETHVELKSEKQLEYFHQL